MPQTAAGGKRGKATVIDSVIDFDLPPAPEVNNRSAALPPAEANGSVYLKIPVNRF